MGFKEGETVVYSKTGTRGRITRLVESDGKIWAELDTTGLLYDENALEASEAETKTRRVEGEAKSKKERGPVEVRDEDLRGGDMTIDTSGSCSGAG